MPTDKVRPAGHAIQPYRQAAGYSDKAVIARIPRWKRAGVKRILRHGFFGEQTPAAFEAWAKAMRAAGVDTGAAFGMGGWTEQHPAEAGKAVGSVFAHPLCSIGAIDAEGAYDNDMPNLVRQFGVVVRQLAPEVFIIDQPWPLPLLHDGFPLDAFDEIVDAHDDQVYDDDFKSQYGINRAPKLQERSTQQWTRVRQIKHVVKPLGISVEGYGHDDNVYDMVDTYYRFPNSTTWTEWEPAESTLMAMEAAEWFRVYAPSRQQQIDKIMATVTKVDDARPMTPSRAVVGVYQSENGLKVDYKAGFNTMAKMGIKRQNVVVSMFRAAMQVFSRAA